MGFYLNEGLFGKYKLLNFIVMFGIYNKEWDYRNVKNISYYVKKNQKDFNKLMFFKRLG